MSLHSKDPLCIPFASKHGVDWRRQYSVVILFREAWLVTAEWVHEYSLSIPVRWGKAVKKSSAEPQGPHSILLDALYFLKYTWQCIYAKVLTELGINTYFFKNTIKFKIKFYVSIDYLSQHVRKSWRQFCVSYHLFLLK